MPSKILVVEDSYAFRNFLTRNLTQHGCDVHIAETYAQAKVMLEQNNDYLCTVLDYCLPDAQDGEVVDLALKAKQRVIVVTATYRQSARDHFIEQGVLDYIIKDSDAAINDLLSMITRLEKNGAHHALVVDDSEFIRKSLSQVLSHQYIRTTIACDGNEALEKLAQHPDITFAITDHSMPNLDGLSLVRQIRRKQDRNALPILGLSGSEDRTLTSQFLKAGANDFLYIPFNQEELNCRIHYILGMIEANEALYRLANQDELTGLWNRRYLFNQAKGLSDDVCVSMIDIDHFKKVNDNYGHDCGDLVIKTIAKILAFHFDDACVARMGGEEFCILYQGDYNQFVATLEKMRLRIETMTIPYYQHTLQVTISLGATNQSGNLEEKLLIADDYLYEAKQQGRNQLKR